MIARLLVLVGWRKIFNLALLLLLTGLLGWELSDLIRSFPRNLAISIIIVGISLMAILARSKVTNTGATLVSVLSGSLFSLYSHAGLSDPLVSMLRASASIPTTLLQDHSWPDLAPLALAWGQFLSQLNALLTRIGDWISAMLQGNYGNDPSITSLLWGLILWLITTWATWWILRLRRPIPAVAPAGILLASSLNYTRGNAIILAPFVAITLLLMALNRYDVEERYWQKNDIDYAEDIRLDMIIVVPLLVLGLAALASITPSVSLNQVVRLARQVTHPFQSQAESLADSLGLEEQPASPASLDAYRSPGLPQQHLLGSGPELSQQVVMVIRTGDLPAMPTLDELPQPPMRYYWRSLTYDIYTGQGWLTSPTESIRYSAGQPAVVDIPADSGTVHMVEQSVLFSQDSPGVLYASGLLVTVDEPFVVAWRIPSEGIADAFGATSQSHSYNASSLLITPSIEKMRSTDPVYPEWILERYLTLPENLPRRVTALALELTRDQPTVYDQAVAIETFLRGFPYSLDVPKPPAKQDVVDTFLFELKRGYCDYYASAMVVLSRAAGLPARLVSGYASGTYDAPNARYVVTADNAHSWVEIYFSGIGWVEFEPTGSLPSIIRSDDQAGFSQAISDPKPLQRFTFIHWLKKTSWSIWVSALVSSLLSAITLRWVFDLWRLRHLSSQKMLTQIYSRLLSQGNKLTIGQQSGDTPYEFATRFYIQFNDLISRRKFVSLFSPASGELEKLIQSYVQLFYSPHPISPSVHREAIKTWAKLYWRLWALRIIRRTSRIKIIHH